MSRRRAFTLIEMLVVAGIIAVLMALLLPAIDRVRRDGQRKAAWTSLRAIVDGLAAYRADHGVLPRTSPRRGPAADLLRDDAPALYAGLLGAATVTGGGGAGSPYTSWERVGRIVDRTRLEAASMGYDGVLGVEALSLRESERPEVQGSCGPRSATPLVLLDPWGGPIHYREWASVADAVKRPLIEEPVARPGVTGVTATVGDDPIGPLTDRPHDALGFDVWTNGPNGFDELGQGDDITTWGPP